MGWQCHGGVRLTSLSRLVELMRVSRSRALTNSAPDQVLILPTAGVTGPLHP
jgi:hypothetical protein